MATVTLSDVGSCVCSHRWPVMTLCMGLVSQSPTARMASAYPFMEFFQYIRHLLCGETFKIQPAQRPFIWLSIHEGKYSRLDLDPWATILLSDSSHKVK